MSPVCSRQVAITRLNAALGSGAPGDLNPPDSASNRSAALMRNRLPSTVPLQRERSDYR